MNYYEIEGGKPLVGEVQIAGAKNVAGKLVLASILTDEVCELKNFPQIGETEIALEIAKNIGAEIAQNNNSLQIRTSTITTHRVSNLSRKNRLPILAIGPLLHRVGKAHVPKLGGDKIGPRPVNFHLQALEKLGIDIEETADAFIAKPKKLKGAKIKLPFPSVGTTETVLLTACYIPGQTIIENAAMEPEILDLIVFLQKMGAQISLGRTRTIFIKGVKKLKGANHWIMPDRIEAVSYASAALATSGDIYLKGAHHIDLITYLGFIKKIGGEFATDDHGIRIWKERTLLGTNLTTDVHPGFMTDWQQPSAIVLATAQGVSTIHETIYEDRLGFLEDIAKMGLKVRFYNNCPGEACHFWNQDYRHAARIFPAKKLSSINLTMPDIRAGMAYVIAALTAIGKSQLYGIEHLDRGYEKLEEKLIKLGAHIKRSNNI